MNKTLDQAINQTLVDNLRSIEKLPDSTIDKSTAYRNILRHWSERSYLVLKFIRGETSPSQEIEKLAKRIGGLKAFVPIYLRDEDKQQIKELEPIVEGIHHDFSNRFTNLISNPIGLASAASMAYEIIFPFLTYLLNNFDTGNPAYVSPQLAAFAGAVHGAVIGGLASYINLQDIRHVRESGHYLESKIREIGRI